MPAKNLPEVWLRGPVEGIPTSLQPVAHALLQAREELSELMNNFPDALLWRQVAGMASPGFHLQHLTGVLNRLYTYANGAGLTGEQLNYLKAEGKPTIITYTPVQLVQCFNEQVDKSLMQLSNTHEATLTEIRYVGRAQLPSTVLGLYMHSAEHTMRHLGQLIVTVKVLAKSNAAKHSDQ